MTSSAQTYTLEMFISQRSGWFWGNHSPIRKTHLQLTIRFPKTHLAQSLDHHLRDLKYKANSRKIFTGETTKVLGCDVTIILPTSVRFVQTNTHGIIIHFNALDDATAWWSYFPSWFQPNTLPNSGQTANQLAFNYQRSTSPREQAHGVQASSYPQGGRRQHRALPAH